MYGAVVEGWGNAEGGEGLDLLLQAVYVTRSGVFGHIPYLDTLFPRTAEKSG